MRRHGNLLLVALAVLLSALPLALGFRGEAPRFAGSDDLARAAVATVAPGYRPWARPVAAPPSGEVESLLFALQAALGAGFIGYYFGLRRGRAAAGGKPGC